MKTRLAAGCFALALAAPAMAHSADAIDVFRKVCFDTDGDEASVVAEAKALGFGQTIAANAGATELARREAGGGTLDLIVERAPFGPVPGYDADICALRATPEDPALIGQIGAWLGAPGEDAGPARLFAFRQTTDGFSMIEGAADGHVLADEVHRGGAVRAIMAGDAGDYTQAIFLRPVPVGQ